MPSPPSIVLLHGAGASGAVWDAVRRLLAPIPVHAPDLPGRDGEHPPATAEDAARRIAPLLAELPRAPVLVGHSYGGAVALAVALDTQVPLAGLVLVSTGARLRVHPAILEAARAAVARGVPACLGRAAFLPGTPTDAATSYGAVEETVDPRAASADWHACDVFERMEDLASVGARTAVLTGEADLLTPRRYGRYLAERIRGARHVVVPRAGHMAPFEQPEVFAAALRDLHAEWAASPGVGT